MKFVDVINFINCEYVVFNVSGRECEAIEFTSSNYASMKKYYDYDVVSISPVGNVIYPKPGYLEIRLSM